MRKVNNWVRFLKNILIVSAIVIGAFYLYRYFSNSSKENTIDKTPIHIESIKTIAEISTVSYKDEVVIDSIERYKDFGSLSEDFLTIPYAAYNRYIKRRLTLIVSGHVIYGVDLTNGNYSINQNEDTIWINLPKAKILDVVVRPSETEVFEEIGTWPKDITRKMLSKAKSQLRQNAEQLNLAQKAEQNAKRLFEQLITTEKKVVIGFH